MSECPCVCPGAARAVNYSQSSKRHFGLYSFFTVSTFYDPEGNAVSVSPSFAQFVFALLLFQQPCLVPAGRCGFDKSMGFVPMLGHRCAAGLVSGQTLISERLLRCAWS